MAADRGKWRQYPAMPQVPDGTNEELTSKLLHTEFRSEPTHRMQSSKGTNSTSSRRASGPAPANTRQVLETLKVSGQMPGNTRRTSENLKISSQVSGLARQVSEPPKAAATSTTPAVEPTEVPQTTPSPAVTLPTGDNTEPPPTADHFKPPLVLMPPSKISKGPRRNSRPEVPITERPLTFDPEHYNPDGSLRTMHKLPGFDQSYAQAMQARYIRHKQPIDREKELSVNEIFGRSDRK